MAALPQSSISAISTVSTVVATNLKLCSLRPHFYPPRHTSFRLIKTFHTRVSVDDNNQRRLFLPARAFTLDVSGSILQDASATVLVVAGAYALVSGFDNLTRRQIIKQIGFVVTLSGALYFGFVGVPNLWVLREWFGYKINLNRLSRKLVHILSGLLYMGCWPIFSTSTDARYFAALVPLLNCARLLVHGFSLVTNEDLIKSVTREGKSEELLRGPLYYVLMLIICSLVFWRESPVGVISLSMMCGGDGIADIMGRKFGIHKIPYNLHKTWVGSISMFIVGFLISIGMLYYLSMFGYFKLDWAWTIERVAIVALVATLVESLPTKGCLDDNISVPLVSMTTAYLSFGFRP